MSTLTVTRTVTRTSTPPSTFTVTTPDDASTGACKSSKMKASLFTCVLVIGGAILAFVFARNYSNSTYSFGTTRVPVHVPQYGPIPGNFIHPGGVRPQGMPDYAWNMSQMMSFVHPCKDFYRYACGRWIDDHPAEDFQIYNPFSTTRQDMQAIISGHLQEGPSPLDPKAVKKAKILYKSCMDTVSINERRSVPLWPVLQDLGMLNPSLSMSDEHVLDMLIKVAKYREFPLGVLHVVKDPKNSTGNVILLDQPRLPLRSLTAGKKQYSGFRSYVNSVVRRLNLDRYNGGQIVVQNVVRMINFQHGLTQLTTADEDRPSSAALYHRYTLGSLNQYFPMFDWKGYVKGVFSIAEVNRTLTDDEPVVVLAPGYFRKVGPFIRRQQKSALMDFIKWSLVDSLLPFLSEEFRTARHNLLWVHGYELREVRWEVCTSLVDGAMFNVTGRLFIDQSFDQDALNVTKEMVDDIREVVREKIVSNTWMDKWTTQKAIEKLDDMREMIGYPPEILNDTLLDQQYEDLTITGHFFEDIVSVKRRTHLARLRKLRHPAIREEWTQSPTAVNAFYKADSNAIVIPAALLRKPFFSTEYPKSVIYASLGMIVAHEITHAFDNNGREYGKAGSLVNWWSDTAERRYRQKATCYKDQYSAYVIDEISSYYVKVNGTRTLGENIADNGGLRSAYKAYSAWISRHTEEAHTVPSLGLNNNQVFYLAFAQRWCESIGEKNALSVALFEKHAPNAFRVKGTVENSEQFAQTFNCETGTPMNPHREKCQLW